MNNIIIGYIYRSTLCTKVTKLVGFLSIKEHGSIDMFKSLAYRKSILKVNDLNTTFSGIPKTPVELDFFLQSNVCFPARMLLAGKISVKLQTVLLFDTRTVNLNFSALEWML